MKISDGGDFCILYVEPGDEKSSLFQRILEQKKPIVIMLAEQARVFQRPDDFVELKHIRRHLDMPVLFVASNSERLVHLAGRNGFPVYLSMDALMNALKVGQFGKQRGVARKTIPLTDVINPTPLPRDMSSRKTTTSLKQLPAHTEEATVPGKTAPLLSETWERYERPDDNPSGREALDKSVSVNKSTRPSSTFASDSGEPVGARFIAPTMSPTPTSRDKPMWSDAPIMPPASTSYDTQTLYHESVSRPTPTSYATMPDVSQFNEPMSNASTLNDVPTVPTQPLIAAPLPVKAQPRVNRLAMGMIILLLIALITASSGYFLIMSHTLPTDAPAMTNVVLGHVTFVSSNQLSETSSQGLNDEVLVDLNKLAQPAAGKSYYAWLLGDKSQSDMKTILLGTLPVTHGHAQLFYSGDSSHTNLLGITSRFLVTEEDAGMVPLTPSPDYSTWRYSGAFSQMPINTPGNTEHFSYLDHLRHLLAADPTLDELELPGGLNTWLYRNVSKILEWTGSTRDQWQESKDVAFVRRQTLRTLTYLDGVSFVRRDLPPNMGLNVNERLARIGLLDVDGPTQDPPGYLSHVSKHLYGLLDASTATPDLRAKVAAIVAALDNVKTWLVQVHHDAFQIMKMSDKQLRQPATLSLLNDMIANATNAFTGQLDPASGQMHEGVTWIYNQIQSMATFDVTVTNRHDGSGPLQMVPDINARQASIDGGNA